MSLDFVIESGTSAYANASEALTEDLFGTRYISYRNVDRFLEQIEDANIGMIVWPGGTLAETRDDRYGFDFDALQNPDNDKPGLDGMMAIAIDQDASLSVILPTARYVDDLDGLRTDLNAFLETLLAGDLGPLPETLIFEIGSEYYANFEGSTAAADYGTIADLMITEIATALADPSVNQIGADITIATQAGKTLADDIAIRDALSDFAISNVDTLIHHRFAYQPQGIDPRIAELQDILDAWEDDTGDAPNLFVSSWNTVTLTRNGVLNDYILQTGADPADIDLDGRTTTAFENFWQEELANASYGQEHAAYLLESFASYAEAGADAAAHYGTDLIHPGRTSWQEDGTTYDFVGAELLEMLYESVGDTYVLASDGDYDPQAKATTYGFENDDKLVLFIAAGDTPPGDITLDIDGLGATYTQVWAERLTGETPDNWMSLFDIPDNPHVDESAEADTYAVGIREAVHPDIADGQLSLSLDTSHEIIRLAFAKTDAGAQDIASWAEGNATDLTDAPLPPIDPGGGPIGDDEEDEIDNDIAMLAEAASSGGGMGLLFMLLFFL